MPTRRSRATARSWARSRVPLARKALAACRLCAHRCGVSRLAGPAGVCRCDATAHVFQEEIVRVGEDGLVPTYAVGLSGCNMACAFCISEASGQDGHAGPELDVDAIAGRIRRAAPSLRSVTIIGGEPGVHLDGALAIASRVPASLPLVWKTNAYASADGRRLLEGIPDTIIADYKYGNDACAKRLAGVRRYTARVRTTLRWARRTSRLIVRHLLMPGHGDCCLVPVMTWLARAMPDAPVSLMTAFLPVHRARRHPELNRTNRRDEADRAGRLLDSLGLKRVPWRMTETPGLTDPAKQNEIWIDRDGRVFVDEASGDLISVLKQLSDESIIDASTCRHGRRHIVRTRRGAPHADRTERAGRD